MYDIIIIGGGPAGVAAGVYAARKRLKTLFLTESFGGQSIVSDSIENWIGETSIGGMELAKRFEAHVRRYEDMIDVRTDTRVSRVERGAEGFVARTEGGDAYEGKAVIVATGGRRRELGIPGEAQFKGKGVAYCSTCDAPLFKGKDVAVVGGGNAGFEAVVDLLPYAARIYLLEVSSTLSGDATTREAIERSGTVTVYTGAETKAVKGDEFVSELVYERDGKEATLPVQGIFIEVGSVPNSELVSGLVALNERNEIVTDAKRGTTSVPGIFAAGDVADIPYRQNNISAGEGVKAALSAHEYLKTYAVRDSR